MWFFPYKLGTASSFSQPNSQVSHRTQVGSQEAEQRTIIKKAIYDDGKTSDLIWKRSPPLPLVAAQWSLYNFRSLLAAILQAKRDIFMIRSSFYFAFSVSINYRLIFFLAMSYAADITVQLPCHIT